MRRNSFIAFSLVLLSLLFLAAAANFFLWQGRATVLAQRDALSAEKAQMGQSLATSQAELAAEKMAGSTAAAAAATQMATEVAGARQEGQAALATAEAEGAEAAQALAVASEALAEREAELAAIRDAGPLVAFIKPEADALFLLGEPIDILVSASDAQGLAAVNVTANEKSLAAESPDDVPLAVVQLGWTPENAGTYLLSATAINTQGRASQPVSLSLTVRDPNFDPLAEIRAQVEANVVAIRGLAPLEPITPTLVTTEQRRADVEKEFTEETKPEKVHDDALVLYAFDFLDKDYDLYNFYVNFYSDQVLGFYDPETAEFVVISDDNQLDVSEQWTHAHEYVHALQDQYYPLERLADDSLDSEAGLALRAMGEGDATLVQLLYVLDGYFTPAQVAELRLELQKQQQDTSLDDAPPVLVSGLSFPYNEGFDFVQSLYEEGGFAAVDAAWENLPVTTEQILHLDRYRAGDLPRLVALAPLTDTLGTGWRELDEDVLGEFYVRQYLEQELEMPAVDQAATGWGGDRYAVYWNDAQEAFVLVFSAVWDTEADAGEFAGAYAKYAGNLTNSPPLPQSDGSTCWLAADALCLYQAGDATLLVRAPSLDLVKLVADTTGRP